jgi:hypothetical protein
MLVTNYQISAINSYWEKCDEKYLGRTDGRTEVKQYTPSPFGEHGYNILFADLVDLYTHWTYMCIFRHIFLSNYWWQRSDIWLQASYRSKNATHNMVYLYDACDQISDFWHQQLLRKMRWKISWTDGRTDRGKTVYFMFFNTKCWNNYTPAPRRGMGVYCFTSVSPSVRPSMFLILLIYKIHSNKAISNELCITKQIFWDGQR